MEFTRELNHLPREVDNSYLGPYGLSVGVFFCADLNPFCGDAMRYISVPCSSAGWGGNSPTRLWIDVANRVLHYCTHGPARLRQPGPLVPRARSGPQPGFDS